MDFIIYLFILVVHLIFYFLMHFVKLLLAFQHHSLFMSTLASPHRICF